jgi:carbon starvation protein
LISSEKKNMPTSVRPAWTMIISLVRVLGHLLPLVLILLSLWNVIDDYRRGTPVHALPLLVAVLCLLTVAYRYYSAFLAAKVAVLDDSRPTPAHELRDGQNYHPTNKWVLFGHHFAAISGAGPLIGPVLAMQWGYAPGLLWLVAGVCLAGAVQDMLVLAASVRRGGKSLAQIALSELGRPAAIVTSLAILFIVIIALAGLGIVVVKALGGEDLPLPQGATLWLPEETSVRPTGPNRYELPQGTRLAFPGENPQSAAAWGERFAVEVPLGASLQSEGRRITVPPKSVLAVPGSSWGLFTIACTVPIALFVGLYMYRIRKGAVVEASLIGAVLVLAATIVGSWIPNSPLRDWFSLSKGWTTFALASYGFVASVLPVWLLLCPRDYLSSFLKIGTIALLIIGLFAANPVIKAPPLEREFLDTGPTFGGSIFPFVFICVMCGAISGFHALVSSGTTPKMVDKESHIRPIGYGAMLMEGIVGVVALLAAASLHPTKHYYPINTKLEDTASGKFKDRFERISARQAEQDALHRTGVRDLHQLPVADRDLSELERLVGGEVLRGRTGGAVTLAVGMAVIFTDALANIGVTADDFVKYWYHFAIMFEALFILTTIDTGTRIARFLLQEALGKVIPRFEQTDWLPGAVLTTWVVTAGWAGLVATGSISTIWPMFGIANQLLAVLALALVTTVLVNSGRGRFAPVTLLPMLFVTSTTMSAGAMMVFQQFPAMIRRGQELGQRSLIVTGYLNIGLTLFVIVSVGLLLLMAVSRWLAVWMGGIRVKPSA